MKKFGLRQIPNERPAFDPALAERAEAAAYLARMAADMSGVSRRQGFATLAYLLDMVRLEAEIASRQNGGES